ncbi:LLM class flavin-dependent oxidoreductase [Haloarcula hispanica]|uniref:LLM class flavin-dependent oxidoreductase n=1 Tax=Haloarcula hispanica TaxID=51589 RepID=A0A5J5LGY6_HALHI|nr:MULTISPECIES: LLM class flavin-dependent oxidoreductase [Haloarcula]KAA9409197.1 LLM class flavin-dependent oxidoreductase [Haloarcula hispanica]MUV49808.1 LLM class flavin-dependent oxidoreductase [Haloarcula sp. CBA1122]
MHLGVVVPRVEDHSTIDLAVEAENWGYDSVWLNELWGASSVVELTDIATRTEDIEIGSAILNVFSRSPAVLAMTATTLDRVSDGRAVLGLGTSTARSIENMHSMEFERPVRRAHETIDIVKQLMTSDERVTYDGEVASVRGVPPLDRDVPVYHAALGPANRRVVARLADGWLPHMVPFSELESAFDYIVETARDADRDPSEITVAPYVPAVVHEDSERATEELRQHIAYYVGSGEGYRRAVAETYPDRAERIADAWQAGDRGEATELVTDEMTADLGIAGTPEQAQEKRDRIADRAVIDRLLLTVPQQVDGELARTTIRALGRT